MFGISSPWMDALYFYFSICAVLLAPKMKLPILGVSAAAVHTGRSVNETRIWPNRVPAALVWSLAPKTHFIRLNMLYTGNSGGFSRGTCFSLSLSG